MTPRPHRRRSSKENRARRCDVLDPVDPCSLAVLGLLRGAHQQYIPPLMTGSRYGFPSRHSGGTAIGR